MFRGLFPSNVYDPYFSADGDMPIEHPSNLKGQMGQLQTNNSR